MNPRRPDWAAPDRRREERWPEKVPSRREAKKPPKSKKSKAKLEPFSEPPQPTVEEIKPRRKPRSDEGEAE